MPKYVYVQLNAQAGAASETLVRVKADTVEKAENVCVVKSGGYHVAKFSAASVERWWVEDED